MTANRLTIRSTGTAYLPFIIAAALSGTACEFDDSGTGNGPPPNLCQLDLDPGPPMMDDAPDSGIVEGDGLFDAEDFIVRWNICYHAASDDWDGDTGEFTAQVEILDDDDELYWIGELQAEPMHKHHCRWDELYVEEGLPPGHYTIRLTVDPDGSVPECSGDSFVENNTTTLNIEVLPIPIDDVTTPPPGDDGPDDSLENPDAPSDPDPAGAQLADEPRDDPAPDDSNPRDPPPDDPEPGDPSSPDPIDPVFTSRRSSG